MVCHCLQIFEIPRFLGLLLPTSLLLHLITHPSIFNTPHCQTPIVARGLCARRRFMSRSGFMQMLHDRKLLGYALHLLELG